jgi:starch-binding outer membrane protein, SusD/RagB family
MKRKIFSIVLAGLLLGGAGCTKKLDTVPAQSIDEKDALKTGADVQVALVGAYSDMGDIDLHAGRIYVHADLLGDFNELNWEGTFQGMTQIYNKAMPVDNLFATNTWLAAYTAINDVNNVLSALDVVAAAQKDRTEGEARFIRGTVYFDLVRLYAKAWNDGTPANNPGVPLVLTPTRGVSATDQRPRNKVSEVYAQIITDLTTAEAKLPVSNGFYATKNAAAAMLARVYLQQGDYPNALAAANRVISSVRHSLTATFAAAFPFPGTATAVSNTSEDIFTIQVNATQGVNSFHTFYSPLSRGDIDVKPAHFALYEAGDARRNFFVNAGGAFFTAKHQNRFGNVHISRLAEMYLIRAECNVRGSTNIGDTPLNDVNRIRNRAGLASLVSVNLAAVLKERKIELSFEGFNLHDIKRLQGTVGALAWNSPKLVFPIPQREIIVNPNLTQNEGY